MELWRNPKPGSWIFFLVGFCLENWEMDGHVWRFLLVLENWEMDVYFQSLEKIHKYFCLRKRCENLVVVLRYGSRKRFVEI